MPVRKLRSAGESFRARAPLDGDNVLEAERASEERKIKKRQESLEVTLGGSSLKTLFESQREKEG